MQEIKFRAKLIKRWNTNKAGDWIYFDLKMLDEKQARLPIDWKTVCQYIGKRDKNGKEIYEDDIVGKHEDADNTDYNSKPSRWINVVKFNDETAGFDVLEKCLSRDIVNPDDTMYEDEWSDEGIDLDELEVIGNIWENPELLK